MSDCLNCRKYLDCVDSNKGINYICDDFDFSYKTSAASSIGVAIGKMFNYR